MTEVEERDQSIVEAARESLLLYVGLGYEIDFPRRLATFEAAVVLATLRALVSEARPEPTQVEQETHPE